MVKLVSAAGGVWQEVADNLQAEEMQYITALPYILTHIEIDQY